MKSFNIEELNKIPIKDVLLSLGAEETHSHKIMKCCNNEYHQNNDKTPSLRINEDDNYCKCYVCNLSGPPVNVAKQYFNDDFKKGCEYLHETFNIPYLSGELNHNYKSPIKKREIIYEKFDPTIQYSFIDIEEHLDRYEVFEDVEKMKLIYTLIYQFSLNRNVDEKMEYYRTRKLVNLKTLDLIGSLNKQDIYELLQELKKYFNVDDLIKFKILNDKGTYWRYDTNASVSVIPSFDLYSNMVTGFMIRYLEKRDKFKEFNISCYDLAFPLPFGFGYKSAKNCERIWLTEGHIDGLTVNSMNNTCFCSFTGVFAYTQESLGLFENKEVVIAFDKDKAGVNGMKVLANKLIDIGIKVYLAKWDSKDGEDLNDLLLNGKMQSIRLSVIKEKFSKENPKNGE